MFYRFCSGSSVCIYMKNSHNSLFLSRARDDVVIKDRGVDSDYLAEAVMECFFSDSADSYVCWYVCLVTTMQSLITQYKSIVKLLKYQ